MNAYESESNYGFTQQVISVQHILYITLRRLQVETTNIEFKLKKPQQLGLLQISA